MAPMLQRIMMLSIMIISTGMVASVFKSPLLLVKSRLLLRDVTLSVQFLGNLSSDRVNALCADGTAYLYRKNGKTAFVASRFSASMSDVMSMLGVYNFTLGVKSQHKFLAKMHSHSPWLVGRVVAFVALFHSVDHTGYPTAYALFQHMNKYRPLGVIANGVRYIKNMELGLYGKLIVVGAALYVGFRMYRECGLGFAFVGSVLKFFKAKEPAPEPCREFSPAEINQMCAALSGDNQQSVDSTVPVEGPEQQPLSVDQPVHPRMTAEQVEQLLAAAVRPPDVEVAEIKAYSVQVMHVIFMAFHLLSARGIS
jgi:hypothetical protein